MFVEAIATCKTSEAFSRVKNEHGRIVLDKWLKNDFFNLKNTKFRSLLFDETVKWFAYTKVNTRSRS